MKLSELRVGLRLARRELRRTQARTALVVVLIMLPTATMAAVATLFRTGEISREGIRAANYGAATYRANYEGSEGCHPYSGCPEDETPDALVASVPAGTPVLVEHTAQDRVRGADFARTFMVSDVDLTDPLVGRRYLMVDGRAPRAASEAVVTKELAAALDLQIGSVFEPERLARPLRVVGTMSAGDDYSDVVVTKSPLPLRPTATVFIGATGTTPTARGWIVHSETYTVGAGQLSNADKVLWTYVGGAIGLFVLGTIVTAAFALGARRQLRSIGLLSASGASPRVIRWALTAQGAVAGLAGSIVGVAIGVAAVRLLPDHLLHSITSSRRATAVTRLIDLVPIVAIGVVAATFAAAFPGRTAARLPTLQALASRRPAQNPRRGSWLAAAGILAVSAALLAWVVRSFQVQESTVATLLAIIGGVLPFVSTLVVAPLAVARLERLFTGASLPWRLAARSIARNGARSAAVVGATCAVVGLVIAVPTFLRSLPTGPTATTGTLGTADYDLPYVRANQVLLRSFATTAPDENGQYPSGDFVPPTQPVPERDVARVQSLLPAARQVDVPMLIGPDGRRVFVQFDGEAMERLDNTDYNSTPSVTVATPELLALYQVNASQRRLLDAGNALAVAPPGYPEWTPADPSPDGFPVLHVGGRVVTDQAAFALPRVLIDADVAKRHDWRLAPAGVTVFANPQPFTRHEIRQLRLFELDLQWEQNLVAPPAPGATSFSTSALVGDAEPRVISPVLTRGAAFAGAALLALAIIGFGLALSARDNQDERAALDAMGAPPRTRRQIGTRRAALLVLTASVIALPAALIPLAAMVAASTRIDVAFRLDWLALVAATIGLPAFVAFGAAVGARARDSFRPTRPDTSFTGISGG